jgi:hypothetical protein
MSEPLVAGRRDALEQRVCQQKHSPELAPARTRKLADDPPLEFVDTLALPQLVREGDEQVFEPDILVAPARVGYAKPCERPEPVAGEQLPPSDLVLTSGPGHLCWMEDLSCVVEGCAEDDLACIEADPERRETVDQQRGCLGDQLMVTNQSAASAQLGQQHERIGGGVESHRQ